MNKGEKILTVLYPLFAFLLPLQTRWIVRDTPVGDSVWEYGRAGVYGFDIVLVVIVFFIFLSGSRRKAGMTLREIGLTAGVLAFVGYEIFVSLDPLLTAVVLFRIALIALAVWFLCRLDLIPHPAVSAAGYHQDGDTEGTEPLGSPTEACPVARYKLNSIVMRRTIAAFVCAMTLSAAFGAAQFFTQSSILESKWLGLSWQEASVWGTSVVETQGGRWLRAHGSLPNPNILGGFSAIALMMFLVLNLTHGAADRGQSPRARPWMEWCRKVFVIAAPVILLAGVVTAASRAAILAVVAGGIVFAWQARCAPEKKMILRWVKGIAIAGFALLLLTGPVAFTRLTAQGRLEALSFTKRAAAFTEAVATLKAHGAKGTGLGAATAGLRELYPRLPIWELQPVHNIPILLLVELGIGGVIIIVLLTFLFVHKFPISNFQFSNKSQLSNPNRGTISPLLVCWFVLTMFDHYLWTLPAGLYISVVFLLVTMKLRRIKI